MTTNASFDDRLAAWLEQDSAHRVPDHLDEVLVLTRPMPQRKWWSSPERWLPMDVTARAGSLAPPRLGRLVLVGLLIIAIAAVALLAIGSRAQRVPPPFGPADNGVILSWSQDGEILATDPDGSNARTIVSDPAYDFGPWFSHDGTRFVFWRRVSETERHLMVANADGSDVRQLSGKPLIDADWFEWSPGDDLVAVVETRNLQRVLTIYDAKGSTPPLQVDHGDLDVDNSVYWLPPAGDELIYTARETPFDAERGLYSVKRDGSGVRPLGPVASDQYYDIAVAPDGKAMAYANIEADSSDNGIGWHLHLRDLETGRDRPVTFGPRTTGNVDEHGPVFSPDGRQLLLWMEEGDMGRLMVAPSDGSASARVIGPQFLNNGEFSYAFSPDGRTAILNVGKSATWLIDLASGKGEKTDEPIRNYATWQRLAQPAP
jgi:Tol biopolymer transport system component